MNPYSSSKKAALDNKYEIFIRIIGIFLFRGNHISRAKRGQYTARKSVKNDTI